MQSKHALFLFLFGAIFKSFQERFIETFFFLDLSSARPTGPVWLPAEAEDNKGSDAKPEKKKSHKSKHKSDKKSDKKTHKHSGRHSDKSSDRHGDTSRGIIHRLVRILNYHMIRKTVIIIQLLNRMRENCRILVKNKKLRRI